MVEILKNIKNKVKMSLFDVFCHTFVTLGLYKGKKEI